MIVNHEGECHFCKIFAKVQRNVYSTMKYVCDECNKVFDAGFAAGENYKSEEPEKTKALLKSALDEIAAISEFSS